LALHHSVHRAAADGLLKADHDDKGHRHASSGDYLMRTGLDPDIRPGTMLTEMAGPAR
jgi:hypothetical protein